MSTYAQLKENVIYELGLAADGDDLTALGRRLNEGVREVLKQTRCRVAVATVTLTSGVDDYELPTDSLAINNIINEEGRPLERVSVEQMHELRRGDNPIDTVAYRYAVDGANLLMIYPMPSQSGELTVYHTPKPTEMSSDSHDPSSSTYGGIPIDYHPLIELHACIWLASADDDSSSGMGQLYEQRFDKGVIKARREIRKRGGRVLGPARIGRPGRLRVPRHPSTDIYYG